MTKKVKISSKRISKTEKLPEEQNSSGNFFENLASRFNRKFDKR